MMVSLKNVGVCYARRRGLLGSGGHIWALKDVTMQLHEGETLGVLGRNSAGKSTLLRVLAGIIRPDRGTCVNPGHKAALLSLQAGFNMELTGRQNIVLSGLLLGMSRRAICAKEDDIIEFAEIREFIDEPIRTYSTGMRARLGFATACHVDPEILLIDEVMAVGDMAFADKSAELLRQKIGSGMSTVIASHNIHRIKELCTRVVWVKRGITWMDGAPEEVIEAYESFYGRPRGHIVAAV